jgi:hypothetical protein
VLNVLLPPLTLHAHMLLEAALATRHALDMQYVSGNGKACRVQHAACSNVSAAVLAVAPATEGDGLLQIHSNMFVLLLKSC